MLAASFGWTKEPIYRFQFIAKVLDEREINFIKRIYIDEIRFNFALWYSVFVCFLTILINYSSHFKILTLKKCTTECI